MAGIGATLREARERAHLDIVDFEARTKIRAKYLRALEDEEWSLLPGYTYTKGFLRTYADMLGLDGRALVDEFKRQYRDPSELEAPPLTPAARRESRRAREQAGERGGRAHAPARPGRPPLAIAAIVLLGLLIVALAVGVLLRHKGGSTTTTSQTHTGTSTTTGSHRHARGAHRTAASVVGLQLQPHAPVYICLVGYPTSSSSRPHVRLNGVTIKPGDHEPVRHDNHFLIRVGNGQIVLIVNGHRHPLAGPNPLTYEITLHGRVLSRPGTPVPPCG
jgi:hypothetical protein